MYDTERTAKMAPVLDRIPAIWGKYLPEEGWDSLLLAADQALRTVDPGYEIQQVKEKFGTLRIHASFSDTLSAVQRLRVSEIIDGFERLSAVTCEYCGDIEDVAMRHNGWYKTLCESCDNWHKQINETTKNWSK